MKSLFVGNLAWAVTDEDLKNKFVEFGNVLSARVITDKFSGKSRGFGFVDMDDADAEKAIAGMAEQDWNGRKITVNEAKPRAERGNRS
ncbi:MAG: RNA-binding protein [Candidatus Margulisiibacteriota bacterium]|nr:RNA-binding protein [Candidatus Margulisiibacteriota bacterium]